MEPKKKSHCNLSYSRHRSSCMLQQSARSFPQWTRHEYEYIVSKMVKLLNRLEDLCSSRTCAIAVAHAAPAIPLPKKVQRTTSPIPLRTMAISKAFTGPNESFMAKLKISGRIQYINRFEAYLREYRYSCILQYFRNCILLRWNWGNKPVTWHFVQLIQ